MKGRQLFVIGLLLVCLILVATATDALACPMCKSALASHDRNHGDWVGGFFWSILFMLSMPFILLGTFTVKMYLLVRRARRDGSAPKFVGGAAAAMTEAVMSAR